MTETHAAAEQSLRQRDAELLQLRTTVNHREAELAQARQAFEDVQQSQSYAQRLADEREGELQKATSTQLILQEQNDQLRASLDERDEELHDHRNRLAEVQEQNGRQAEELANMRRSFREAQADLQDVTRKKDIARAAAVASRNSSIELYQQLLASLETMLAQAVLPLPQLTRKRTEQQQRRLLIEHAQFDADWYVATYPDVAVSSLDPALHFIRHGMAEGRSPNAKMAHLRDLAMNDAARLA